MKKKSRLLLLALLPLLTCCTVDEGSTNFKIKEFDDSDVLHFNLEDGLDLTAPFGLYDRNVVFGDRHLDEHFMFLASNTNMETINKSYSDRVVWTRFYDVTDRNEDCYYEKRKGGSDNGYHRFYSKQANLHLDSKFFDSRYDTVEITLTYSTNFDSDEYRYWTYELDYPCFSYMLFYSIDKDQTVTMTPSRRLLPKKSATNSEASSGEESLSSSLA